MSQETNRASVAHLSDRGTVRVTGADAAKFLQGLVTNDVESLVTKPDDLAFAASAAHAAIALVEAKKDLSNDTREVISLALAD